MRTHNTVIVIGPSGSGKGTQIKLLKEYIQKQTPETKVFHFEAGSHFRSFVEQEGYTSKIMRGIISKGILAPDFITEWFLTSALVENMNEGNPYIIFDGFPRTVKQAYTLDSAMEYYGRSTIKVLNFMVPEDEVRTRMLSRGRGDDLDEASVENRIVWYRERVLPTVEFFRWHPNYEVIDIDGVGDITDIHHTVLQRLALLEG